MKTWMTTLTIATAIAIVTPVANAQLAPAAGEGGGHTAAKATISYSHNHLSARKTTATSNVANRYQLLRDAFSAH